MYPCHAAAIPVRRGLASFVAGPVVTYTDHSAPVQANAPRSNAMSRMSHSLIVALATLAFAAPLATGVSAQDRPREREDRRSEQPRPRVSPDEARRGASPYGRPIDTQPRRDGNYSVLVERGGQVRDVTVDGQTGRARPSEGSDNRNNNDQRPRRPN